MAIERWDKDYADMIEVDDGDWVTFAAHEAELTALREQLATAVNRAEAAEAVVGSAFSLVGDNDDSTVWNNTLSPLTNETWKAIHEILLARQQKGGV